jgi:hypothetical protein
VFQYLRFHKVRGTIETVETESNESLADTQPISNDDQFQALVGHAVGIPGLTQRVEELFPKKQKRTQVSPPRPLGRGSKFQTPGQRRKARRSRSGKSGLSENQTQLRISSPKKGSVSISMDSEDFGSDIVVTDVFEKVKPNW